MSRKLRLKVVAGVVAILLAWTFTELVSIVVLNWIAPPVRMADGRQKVAPESVWKPRDAHRSRKKPWHRYRIVTIGDSCTYGLGVKPTAPYPRVLQELLNQDAGFDRFEVINLGVAGYTSTMGLLQLRELGLSFQPDLVIASFGLNDKWRAEINDREKTRKERSAMAGLRFRVAGALEYSPFYRLLRHLLGPVIRQQKMRFSNLRAEYRVPLQEYYENLTSIAEESRAAGAEVLFLFQMETPAIRRLTEEGIAAYERGEFDTARQKLEEVAEIRFLYYPRPLWYLAETYRELKEPEKERKARKRSRQFARLYPFPHAVTVPFEEMEVGEHLDGREIEPWEHFDIFARYRQTMARVSDEQGVPMVVLDEETFGAGLFFDYCHMIGAGYRRVAGLLAPVILEEILPRQNAAKTGGNPMIASPVPIAPPSEMPSTGNSEP